MVNQIWTYQVIGAGNAAAFGAEVRPEFGALAAPTARDLQMFTI